MDFQKSVEANRKAANLLEWDSSEYHPQRLFKTYRDESGRRPELRREVCLGLSRLTPQELSLFEEEMNNPENTDLLKDCRDSLKKTLEEYWREQKKSL